MSRSTIIFIAIFSVIHISNGLYIRSNTEVKTQNKNEWSLLNQKLGLLNKNVENSKYKMNAVPIKRADLIMRVYSNIVHQLKTYDVTMNTSINIKLAHKSLQSLRRHRRKIAVKMDSEIPSEQIDDLLKLFNEKYGIGNISDETDDVAESEVDYIDYPMKLPSATDPDYMYENLYEDEKDLAIPAKSRHNSEYGSLQDLILQASRNQWQREIDEIKLHTHTNKHFI